MMNHLIRVFPLCWLWVAASQANIITDPVGLDTPINSNALTIEQEVGTISLTAFNALSLRYAITFEASDGYPTPGLGNPASRLDRVEFTEAESGYGQRIDIGSTGFRLISDFRPTGGTNDLVLQSGSTMTLALTNAVQGIAFTANRISGTNLTVRLYSDIARTTQIGSDYLIDVNAGAGLSERSFFGYYDGVATIHGVEIIGTGAAQYGIDDLNIALIPEPSVVMQLMLGAGLVFFSRYVRRSH